MKIVVAPDSFKESLSSEEAALAIERGFREVWPDAHIVLLPMADGGEGTTQAVVSATGGRLIEAKATGPLGGSLDCVFGMTPDETAVIELAAASGLHHVLPSLRNPLRTTTYGTGELIREALKYRPTRMVIGLGGSATVDGGAGLLQALGARLLDADGEEIGRGGAALAALHSLDLSGLDPRLMEVQLLAAYDVRNPLVGPTGAAAVYGPQKGATPEMVTALDANLQRLADVIYETTGVAVAHRAGAGAAGGTGAALLGCVGATLEPGVALIAKLVNLERELADADLVVTGEGRIDSQTIHGKTPVGVAEIAKRHGKPVIAFAGALSEDAAMVHAHGIDAVFSISLGPQSTEAALRNAAEMLRSTARNAAALLRLRSLWP